MPTSSSSVTQCAAALLCLALSGFMAQGATAATVDMAGVKIEDTAEFRGNKLQLNGAGIRYKAIFKVYVAALYLGKKAATADDALQAPGPKRISITMLRDIDASELGRLFTHGVEDNITRAEFVKIVPDLIRMGQLFADQKKLRVGDNFVIDWVPASGTTISVKGVAQGEPFQEPVFFTALLRIWLGKSPADLKLKEALLGHAEAPKNNF
jgi:Chalcone isomerase-like